MGQFVALHARMQELLEEIKTAAGGQLRIYDSPPVAPPGDLPCIFTLTPDEDFTLVDVNTGRSIVVFVVRLCVAATKPTTELLSLADVIAGTADVWLRNEHPAPIDQARRTGMRGVTPVFDGVPTRGADFPIRLELDFRPITPAP